MDEENEAVDLLGEPLRPLPDKRGRRKLRFAAELYEKVEVLTAGGMGQDDIADAVGISAPTLRKYFRKELDNGLARQEAESLALLAEQARKGNVSAIKAWRAELAKQRAASNVRDRERPARPVAQPQLGKKEERQQAAERVGGKYAPPPAPTLIN